MKQYLSAVVGQVGRLNRNGTRLETGALLDAEVILSPWDHLSLSYWDSSSNSIKRRSAPAGFGRIKESEDLLIFEGHIDLCLPSGRLAHALIRTAGPRCRWSIAYKALQTELLRAAQSGHQALVSVQRAAPLEVSPVLHPASAGTRTLELR